MTAFDDINMKIPLIHAVLIFMSIEYKFHAQLS